MLNLKDHILIGKVSHINGLYGEVVVKLEDVALSTIPRQVFIKMNNNIYKDIVLSYSIEHFKIGSNSEAILRISEVRDAIQANFLIGKKLFANKKDLLVSGLEVLEDFLMLELVAI